MSDLNPTSAPFETASPNDHGVSVSIVNVILIIFSGIVVISRAITRVSITRLTALDDVAIFVSLVGPGKCKVMEPFANPPSPRDLR